MAAASKIDHFAFNVEKAQLDEVVSWYLAALAPLSFEKIMEFPGATGLGAGGKPDLWVYTSDKRGPTTKFHIAFTAPNHQAVDDFHAAAVKAGGKSTGEPGLRAEYHAGYYAAFGDDPVGNNVEVVDHQPGH